jgi:hypothetical protein
VDFANPFTGVCIYGRGEVDEAATTSGITMDKVPAVTVDPKKEACDHFEKKVSRRQMMKETM